MSFTRHLYGGKFEIEYHFFLSSQPENISPEQFGKMHLFISFCIFGAFVSSLQVSGNTMDMERNEGFTRNKRSTNSDSSYFFYQQPDYPRDCKEVFEQCDGESSDGVYLIQPDGYLEPFPVYCNNTVDGGNWMVIQRRMDGGVEFNRDWEDYKNGFGFPHRDLWLGNEKLAYITNQKDYEIRFDFVSKSGDPHFAKYNLFRVSDEGTLYRLVDVGDYDSTSTLSYDALPNNKGMAFTTRDRDNDLYSSNCASSYNGWWYNNCYYNYPNYPWSTGPYWYNFPGGNHNIQYIEMKIRPVE
ncbi:fibrinogen-like protein A isoform X2 [Apostichopus japonicus]|uniref:fibrinogen-like protein A isoform X2 n=1 Tax=Stichopus japonicus TaxID=307972 RepID=UPI003AB5829B